MEMQKLHVIMMEEMIYDKNVKDEEISDHLALC